MGRVSFVSKATMACPSRRLGRFEIGAGRTNSGEGYHVKFFGVGGFCLGFEPLPLVDGSFFPFDRSVEKLSGPCLFFLTRPSFQ